MAVKSTIGQCLERLVADRALVIPDIEYASWLLSNMALGNFHLRLQLGLIDKVPAGELDAHLTQVAEDFVQLYRADGAAEVQPGADRVETTAPVAGS